MSNFMLNGITGNVKGGMLDSKMLFDNEGQWQKLELASSSIIYKGDAFAQIDTDGNLHVIGYVQIQSTQDDLDVFKLPDPFPNKFGKGSSNISDVPNPMPMWEKGTTSNIYDYLDVKDCQVINGYVQLIASYGDSRDRPAIIIFPDVVMKPVS